MKSKSSVLFTRLFCVCMYRMYESIIYKGLKRDSVTRTMLLKGETVQESLWPLSVKVVSSPSYMHANSN